MIYALVSLYLLGAYQETLGRHLSTMTHIGAKYSTTVYVIGALLWPVTCLVSLVIDVYDRIRK